MNADLPYALHVLAAYRRSSAARCALGDRPTARHGGRFRGISHLLGLAIGVLLACGLAAVPADAALAWTHQEQTLAPTITATTIDGAYDFTNTGKNPITITGIKPSCSCTVAHLTKSTYQPGEKGTIAVTFNLGTRTGAVTKTIAVSGTDPTAFTDLLTLHVAIPPQASFSRRVISWTQASAPVPQEITITMPPNLGMTVDRLVVNPGKGPAVTAALTTTTIGAAYVVTITPTTTATIGTTSIDLITNLKTYHLYARVAPMRPPRPLAAAPVSTSPAANLGAPAPQHAAPGGPSATGATAVVARP